MIMISVAARTIRATKASLPGYGAQLISEPFPKPLERAVRSRQAIEQWMPSQRPRITTTADSLTRNRSEVGFSTRTRTGYRDARCTQFSVLCTSGSPCCESANNVGVRSHAKSDAIHHARKTHVRFGQDIDVSAHSGRDALSCPSRKFATAHHVRASIEREHLLPGVRIGAFRNREIRDSSVERSVDAAVVQVVARSVYRRRFCAALVDERFERRHGILRSVRGEPCSALSTALERSSCANAECQCRLCLHAVETPPASALVPARPLKSSPDPPDRRSQTASPAAAQRDADCCSHTSTRLWRG